MWLYFDYFQTILNRQDCFLYIVEYIDAISVNSPFSYMICQALHQPSYKFVHSLYVFCHYHYYKQTFLYISELINVFIYLVTYRPIGPGAFCVFVYVIVYKYVNVCTISHNNKPFTYLFTYLLTYLQLFYHKFVNIQIHG